MGSLLVELLPFAIGLAVTPTAVATGILFLSSKRPLGNAIAYAAAFSLVYAGLCLVVLVVAHSSEGPAMDPGTKNRIVLVIGLLLLALALIAWVPPGRPPPPWPARPSTAGRRRGAARGQGRRRPVQDRRMRSPCPPAAWSRRGRRPA